MKKWHYAEPGEGYTACGRFTYNTFLKTTDDKVVTCESCKKKRSEGPEVLKKLLRF
jgi:hypothetical protein